MDWYSFIDAIALLTSLPRTGYDRALVRSLTVTSAKTTYDDICNLGVVRNTLEERMG